LRERNQKKKDSSRLPPSATLNTLRTTYADYIEKQKAKSRKTMKSKDSTAQSQRTKKIPRIEKTHTSIITDRTTPRAHENTNARKSHKPKISTITQSLTCNVKTNNMPKARISSYGQLNVNVNVNQ
jgi:hypothetical protein